MIRRVSLRLTIAATAALLTLGAIAWGAFPPDDPNDYDPDCEDYPFYSFIPGCTPNASDLENASGMSIEKAWKQFTAGNSRTVIAYMEAGINWRDGIDSDHPQGDVPELANRVFLNRGELPKPTTPKSDGIFNARDYHDTPDANGNGVVDPEDIIKRFSDGVDDDRNGYRDDISGWDFYDDQNDPATVDSAYGHANGQMERAAAQADNGQGGVGECPRCMVLPIKAGAEALDRTDDLAEAWLYADDLGADVIVSVTADLGYSTFMEQAIERIWRGNHTVMVEASNDFDSTDHQGGMFHAHVLPGNGMLNDKAGFPTQENETTTTFRARSGYTSWGTHNVFTGTTYGGSTSESTPTVGGVMALAIAYGKEAAAEGKIARPLTADEAIQVVRETASDVNDPNSNWPSGPGFDLQFGYGRPNIFKAMKAISKDRIPPVGWINSPRWYSLYDPMRTRSVPVRGHVDAPRSPRYRWRLEFAPGAEPESADFITAGRGNGSAPFSGRLGTVDLSKVPQAFWSKAFELSTTKTLETNEHYTVTLRLRVFDAAGRMAEDRRSIAVHHDPSLRRNFPRLIGPGGEAQPQLADLQGQGRLAIVFGDTDGVVHAIDGRTGRELPGWPVTTNRTRVERQHRGVSPGHEPVLNNVAIGDLDHNGRLWVVATTTTGNVYVWDERGRRRAGWPKALDRGVRKPPIPRPDLPFTRQPVQGATAPPVLYDLNGDRRLEIVQAAWSGHLYVWKPNGRFLSGWPKKVRLPDGFQPATSEHLVINDQKVVLPPGIGDIDGDGKPELVVRSQYNEITAEGLQPDMVSHLHAYHANGTRVDGFPNSAHAIVGYYGSAQEFITEGTDVPTLADAVPGDGGALEIANSPGIFSPTYLFDGDGSELAVYGPVPSDTLGLLTGQTDITTVLGPNPPSDAQVTFTTSGAFGRFGSSNTLAFVQPGTGGISTIAALLLPGSGSPIKSTLRAYDAATASDLPGFPSTSQGIDFLGAAVIADLSGDGQPDLIEGGDSSAMHAFVEGGGQAPGFPKFHTGWVLFGPSVGDVNSDGRNDLATMTREGYLMVWRTPGQANANDEWWAYRHDERNTSAYGTDTRPPGAIRRSRVIGGGSKLTFRAAGDDWYAGQPLRYRLTFFRRDGSVLQRKRVAATVPAGQMETIDLPPGARRVRIVSVDDAKNLGRPFSRRVAPTVQG